MVPETTNSENETEVIEPVEEQPTDTESEVSFNFIDDRDKFFQFCDEGIRDLLNTGSKKWYNAEDLTSHLEERYAGLEKDETYNTLWYINIWHKADSLGTYNWNIYRFDEKEKQ